MRLALATALYADATRLYRQGDLHHARDAAEEGLLSLSPGAHSGVTANHHLHGSVEPEKNTDRLSVGCEGLQAQQRRRHHLFGNILLLLSSIYMAVQDYIEAERLLVTCDGYWKERLAGTPTKASPAGTSGDAEGARCGDLDEGLAGVAYNRAVLLLERLQCTPSLSPRRGDSSPWVAPLVDVCGVDARETHSSTSSSTVATSPGTPEAVHARAMAFLLEAQGHLAHTLGPPRRLLADVLHTLGVCHYEAADYIAALEAWQRSIAIRVHLHAQRLRTDHVTLQRDEGGGAGTEELKLALTMEHVAHVYQLLDGRSLHALKLLDTVAQTRRQYLGPTHPLYVRTLAHQGVLAAELGHTRLACALFDPVQRHLQRH
ncbi:hypothetical protein JKF63_06209 [Porcisia hertigi]|uniref:Uncharacterized protein n=1 Tax=Porcisia hertigi TaxID=2761500 RepID=A0A836ICF2_9TRYP|nr:hypothetical protein JKF63_06209 [Porcisia hertigi]